MELFSLNVITNNKINHRQSSHETKLKTNQASESGKFMQISTELSHCCLRSVGTPLSHRATSIGCQ